MYDIVPQMQKIVLCGTEKITILEQIVTEFENQIEKINEKLNDLDTKVQDFNIADMLKPSQGIGGENEEGNTLVYNLISKLEKKINNKNKLYDEKISNMEETNYRLSKDIVNLKNAQDGTKRSINSLKETTEDIISNLRDLENTLKETAPDIVKNLDMKVKAIQNEPEEPEDGSKNEEKKERKESIGSTNKNVVNLEDNEKIKEMAKKIQDLEKAVKLMPVHLGIEQIKSDVNALKSSIGNCATNQDIKEAKDKEDEMQRQISVLKDQFEDFITNTADHDDLQNVKRKLELINSKVHECETAQEELLTKLNQNTIMKAQNIASDKYLQIQKFEDFKTQIIKEFNSINDNFTHLRRLVDNILDALKNKPSYRDIKALEEELLVKIEEFKLAVTKKFAERIETTKNFKYLDQQIKYILQVYTNKENKTDNWLLAKRSLNSNLCASCEAYIGDLKDNNEYQPWNKYPMRDPNDKLYKLGNGFSKMLQMIQVDENDKKNTGTVTQQNNNKQLSIGSKFMKMDKLDGNVTTWTTSNAGPIKTETTSFGNNHKALPKIKANSTMNNFAKHTIDNKNMTANNFTHENAIQQKEGSDGYDDIVEDEQPKITKISKINKE